MPHTRSIVIACARTGSIAILVLLGATFVVAELLPAGPATHATETILASRRTKDLLIVITSLDGGLKGGDNRFCVLFQKTGTEEPVDMRDVHVDFTLLVGRVNLGKQYYVPASYSVFVFYTDATGRKRKERLFLSVR